MNQELFARKEGRTKEQSKSYLLHQIISHRWKKKEGIKYKVWIFLKFQERLKKTNKQTCFKNILQSYCKKKNHVHLGYNGV